MKFSIKLVLSTMIVLALALGFSGFYFVNYVFETSLEREVGQQNSIYCFQELLLVQKTRRSLYCLRDN